MATKLTAKQLVALSRFNREYNIKEVVLSNNDEDGTIEVRAVLHAGKELKEKGFLVDIEGGLAGIIKNGA